MKRFESVSTWRQPNPPPASAARTDLINDVAEQVVDLSRDRVRVAIDGFTAAGKTSFGHELAAAVRGLGRPTLRACLDDFKKPWGEVLERGYDRVSGEGYYRNAHDSDAIRELLLEPAGPSGSGQVVLCARDPLTGQDHRDTTVPASTDAVLIVDSVFAFRPEYNHFWDLRIWLDIDADTSRARAVARDGPRDGHDAALEVHQHRYHRAELIYLAEVQPQHVADLVIDNRTVTDPRLLRRRAP